MSSANAVVMGCVTTLSADHFVPFYASLRSSGFDGHTCVIVARTKPRDQAQLQELVDEIVLVDERYPQVVPGVALRGMLWTKRTRGLRRHFPTACRWYCRARHVRPGGEAANGLELRLQGLQSLRYDCYRRYLRERPEFTHVLISDLRDVVFQGDPFVDPPTGLEVFLEEPESTFAVDGFNRRWIDDLYGSAGVQTLGSQTVSCSGVTCGTREAMLAYLDAMCEEVDQHLPPLGAHDQAIHNWLLYHGGLGEPAIVANGYGRVLTMGEQRTVDVAPDGRVLNRDGTVPPVLHQYDRHVDLAPRLLAGLGS
ncbi:MAG TPA: hypothetical protein VGN51_20840 [Acidimicrobiia bacterium]|jgi:hypothetical protein